MATRVLNNTSTASVTTVKLRAGIASVIPSVGVTQTYPVSKVAYIFLASSSYLDTTGLFKYTTDFISVVENLAFNFAKVVDDDVVYIDDVFNYGVDKNLSDSVTIADAVNVSIVSVLVLNLTDSIAISDIDVRLISPKYTDSISTTDSGVILVQDYCEPLYFATNYVGISATF